MLEIALDVGARGAPRQRPGLRKEFVTCNKIAAVGFERIAAGATFRAHHVEKGLEGFCATAPAPHWAGADVEADRCISKASTARSCAASARPICANAATKATVASGATSPGPSVPMKSSIDRIASA